jgi:NADH-quinone oxidoreductase subunit I
MKKVERGVRKVARDAPGQRPSFFWTTLRGLGVTLRHFFGNVFGRRYTVTREYPEVKPDYPPRMRAQHRLMKRPDGTLRCVACMMCPTVCPAHCITVVAEETTDRDEKRAQLFEIDELRCVMCGLCVEVCPVDAIRMDTGIPVAPVGQRADAVYGAAKLAEHGTLSKVLRVGGRAALAADPDRKGEEPRYIGEGLPERP